MTKLYLVWVPSATDTFWRHRDDIPVNLLVSYANFQQWLKDREKMNVGSWCLDSAAFAVATRGFHVDHDQYIRDALTVDADDIFGLDVIGDAKASRVNYLKEWDAGLNSIPAFHYGSPESELHWVHENATKAGVGKIALGGMARVSDVKRVKWAAQCFSRVWPYRIHGLGMTSERGLFGVPFHTVDASTWRMPMRYGTSKMLRSGWKTRMGPPYDLWSEAEYYRKLAEKAAWKWRDELAKVA